MNSCRLLPMWSSLNRLVAARFISIDCNCNRPQLIDQLLPKHCQRRYLLEYRRASSCTSNMATALCQREVRLPTPHCHLTSVTTESQNGFQKAFSDVVTSSASCLLKGGVIAVPTDTIYGVACLVQNTEAVNRIYEIKNRNFQNPVAISVATVDDVYRWSNVTVPRELLTDLLPGPVTVVFERKPDLNPALNPSTTLVGIRIPNHSFMQSLAKECNSPIALTSANISGATSCLHIEEFQSLWPKLDLVVNGGTLSDTEEARLGSTVIDLSVPGRFRIIRPGSAHQVTVRCVQEKHGLTELKQESKS